MSGRAQSAVNRCSQHTNDIRLFRLLLYLADVADKAGVVDPAPNQETLAGIFEVSDRTIRGWLSTLIDSGELIRTRRGRGEGNPSAYQINLPLTGSYEETGELTGSYEEANPGNTSGNYEESIRKLEKRLESLEEKIGLIFPVIERLQEIEEKLTGITGSVNRKGHSLKSADDPLMIQEEEEREEEEDPPPTPPADSEVSQEQLQAYWHDLCDLFEVFTQASGKRPPPRRTEEQEQKFLERWVMPVWNMRQRSNGQAGERIKTAVQEAYRRNLIVASPHSIESVFFSLLGQEETAVGAPPDTANMGRAMSALSVYAEMERKIAGGQ